MQTRTTRRGSKVRYELRENRLILILGDEANRQLRRQALGILRSQSQHVTKVWQGKGQSLHVILRVARRGPETLRELTDRLLGMVAKLVDNAKQRLIRQERKTQRARKRSGQHYTNYPLAA